MKFNVIFLIIGLVLLLIINNCAGQKSTEINVVMHLKPKFKIEKYSYLYLTNFAVMKNYQVDKDVPIDPNQEIITRLKNEYSKLSNLNVKFLNIDFESTNKNFDDLINDKGYWQNLNIDEKENSLIYTGKIEFENKDASGFFPKEVINPRTGVARTIDVREEKIEVSLGIQLFILSAKTGEILYKETFKETATFSNTADVTLPMFYTLYDRFAPKMFNTIIPYRIRGTRFLITP
mgnify:CR=1 FL=1